jgi:N-acetylglucosaminyl-diphospho-decaprenol L-rhamnosyltransferase
MSPLSTDPDSRPRVGVVTLARGRHAHLEAQHRSLAAGSRLPDSYVVVAMDDPAITAERQDGLERRVVRCPVADPANLPLSRARNVGVAALRAQDVDVVVLLDVDCLAGADLVASYAAAVAEHEDVVWSGPVTYLDPPPPGGYDLGDLTVLESWDRPHPARPAPAPGTRLLPSVPGGPPGRPELFWSLSFAMTPAVWGALGGFDESYVGYGGEDTDFALRATAAGVRLGWDGGARAYHQHHPVSAPPVEHLDAIVRNGARFARRWGTWPMQGWLEEFEARGLVRREGDGWVRAPAPDGPVRRRTRHTPETSGAPD